MLFTAREWALLAAMALLGFWVVGAYNRLVALRNAIGAAWSKVHEAVQQRAAAATPLLMALSEPLAAEQGALDTLRAALSECALAAAAMGARPVLRERAAAWLAAEAAMAAAASRVFALFEHDAALRGQEAISGPATAWREASTRLGFARQLFNDEAAVYNDAVALFPTRLLTPMFGFGPAGKL
jgi:LemA protein